jgi:hypothetical protein
MADAAEKSRESRLVGSWAEASRFAERQARRVSPERRYAWLVEMLEIAETSGALARARAERDREERT